MDVSQLKKIPLFAEVPDEALMAMALAPDRPVPAGTIRYPAAFGI